MATAPGVVPAVLETNAPTFLDELADETALSIDTAALAETEVPLLLSTGTESPALFSAAIAELAARVPEARVEVLDGARHVPDATHPPGVAARLLAFTTDTAAAVAAELGWSVGRLARKRSDGRLFLVSMSFIASATFLGATTRWSATPSTST